MIRHTLPILKQDTDPKYGPHSMMQMAKVHFHMGFVEACVGLMALAFSAAYRDIQLFFTGAGIALVAVRTFRKGK